MSLLNESNFQSYAYIWSYYYGSAPIKKDYLKIFFAIASGLIIGATLRRCDDFFTINVSGV